MRPGPVNAHPDYIRNAVLYSLQRLKTDYIDLYTPARVDPHVPIEETIGALADLVKAGTAASAHGARYEWFAPSTAGSAKITFDPGGGAAKIDTTITIVAPAVEYRNARAVAFPGQAAGVSGVSGGLAALPKSSCRDKTASLQG